MPGGGAVTALVVSATTNGGQLFSKLSIIGEPISNFFKELRAPDQSQNIGTNFLSTFFSTTLPSFFSQLGTIIQTVGQSLRSSTSWTAQQIKSLGEHLDTFQKVRKEFEGLQHFFGDSAEAVEIFKGIHEKIPNIISFFSDSSKSESFRKLFEGNQLEKTKKTLKVLSGRDSNSKQVITAERGLALTLINEFARDPERVGKKIERLVKLVDEVVEDQGRTGKQEEVGQNNRFNTYELTKEKLRSFLKERSEASQNGFEIGMTLEIGAKSKGITLPSTTANVFAILGTFWGTITSKSN